ncbi:MAG: carboxypeptidase-like regulatory domain-containing protein [Bacteroidales bacterium]|nr:carboxypeptidase-like regulatory domain-containing protein [Bacteroidales bacterium]
MNWHVYLKLILIFLITAPVLLSGQRITGRIIDSRTNAPVEMAAVYVDGTTIGTVSNEKGEFVLEYNNTPKAIVVSHINYELKVIPLAGHDTQYLRIFLKQKFFDIAEIAIQGKNRRTENLKYFRDAFLGKDIWGRNAVIENDSVLRFKVEYYRDNEFVFMVSKMKSIEVAALAPLIISLESLGYTLHYDLITFTEKYDSLAGVKVMHIAGKSYFQPVSDVSAFKQRSFERNRQRAFYHSPMHFTRSLYRNKLPQNGYLLFESEGSNLVKTGFRSFYPDSCNCFLRSEDDAFLMGMAGKYFILFYYGYNNGPVDLTVRNLLPAESRSHFVILSDPCIIRRDGTRPANSILFSSQIGAKRIGATLPSDYDPQDKAKEANRKSRKGMDEIYDDFYKRGRIGN